MLYWYRASFIEETIDFPSEYNLTPIQYVLNWALSNNGYLVNKGTLFFLLSFGSGKVAVKNWIMHNHFHMRASSLEVLEGKL